MKKLIAILAFLIISVSCFSQKVYYKYAYLVENNYSTRVSSTLVCFNYEETTNSFYIAYGNVKEWYIVDRKTVIETKEDVKFNAMDMKGNITKCIISVNGYIYIGYSTFFLVISDIEVRDGYKEF